MKKLTNKLFRYLLVVAVIVSCLIGMSTEAKASIVKDIAWVLDQMGSANPFKSYGIDGPALRASEELIEELAKGGDVIECVNKFGENPVGKQIPGGKLPGWVSTLLDVYIAFKGEDYWKAVYLLGEAALCAIAEVITLGFPICSILKEIYEIAAAIVTAVWDFISGVGGAVFCAFAICCCDSGPPDSQLILQDYFAPNTQKGLTAKEAVDSKAYKTYVDSVLAVVKADPRWGANAIKAAADAYEKIVVDLWDKDMKIVLPQLANKRTEYFKDQTVINQMAASAVLQSDPSDWIWNKCIRDFSEGFGFAHVDRWISSPTSTSSAAGVGTLKGNTISNSTWCSNEFAYKHKPNEFKKFFQDYVKSHFCPLAGEKLVCDNDSRLANCKRIMGSISWDEGQKCIKAPPCPKTSSGFNCPSLDTYKACVTSMGIDANKCGANVSAIGQELAQKIQAYFKSQGSKIPCSYGVINLGQALATITCGRPVQQYFCLYLYNAYVGVKLPIKFVECKLTEDKDYTTLKKRVTYIYENLKKGNDNIHPVKASNGYISIIPKGKGQLPVAAGKVLTPCSKWIDKRADPLVLTAEECLFNKVRNDSNQDFGFGKPSLKAGFNYTMDSVNVIDGASTPVLVVGKKPVTLNPQVPQYTLEDMLKNLKPGPGPNKFFEQFKSLGGK